MPREPQDIEAGPMYKLYSFDQDKGVQRIKDKLNDIMWPDQIELIVELIEAMIEQHEAETVSS